MARTKAAKLPKPAFLRALLAAVFRRWNPFRHCPLQQDTGPNALYCLMTKLRNGVWR
jgi:hypothetical protein